MVSLQDIHKCVCRYNSAHIATGIGDVNLAIQCYKNALALHPTHAESLTNLAVHQIAKRPAHPPQWVGLLVDSSVGSGFGKNGSHGAADGVDGRHVRSQNKDAVDLETSQLAGQYWLESSRHAPHLYESQYNRALLFIRQGNYVQALDAVELCLKVHPGHTESMSLRSWLMNTIFLPM
jgi:tetratricopeptide (TPR) repeat protein